MSVNVISKGIVLNFIFNILIAVFLIRYQFEINGNTFTLLLLLTLAATTLYTGYISDRFSEIHGFFIGLASIAMLLLFLSQFTNMNWESNMILIMLWGFVGFISSFLGHQLKNKKNKLLPAKSSI